MFASAGSCLVSGFCAPSHERITMSYFSMLSWTFQKSLADENIWPPPPAQLWSNWPTPLPL